MGVFGNHTPETMGLIDRISANSIGVVIDRRINDSHCEFSNQCTYAIAIVDNQVTFKRNLKVLSLLSKVRDSNPIVSYLFPRERKGTGITISTQPE
jgi:hypothetical protein